MTEKQVLWILAVPHPAASGVRAVLPYLVDAWTAQKALEELPHRKYDIILLDFPIPGWSPAELLERVQKASPEVPVLIRDPDATLPDAVRLSRLGASQCIGAGDDLAVQIAEILNYRGSGELASLAANVGRTDWERLLIGGSPEMRKVSQIIGMVGCRRSTVLITGETGTGKEVAARALHLAGPRRRVPLVAVNCSALPENLLEAELFGHVKGAFTGAVQNRIGRFEQAQGGSLFLDEIGDLPLDLQAKLLRVLQEREYQRLGSSDTIRTDVRVIAATNRDLARRIEDGRFREDLYYRLNVVPLQIPPLRQRREDIPALAAYFASKVCRLEELPAKSLTPEAVERLENYDWPGNVRQLENAIEMAVALSGDRTVLVPEDLPLPAPRIRTIPSDSTPLVSVPDGGLDYEQTLARIERSILEQALRKTRGNKKAAAEMLRLKRTTLSAKMRSLSGMGPPSACIM